MKTVGFVVRQGTEKNQGRYLCVAPTGEARWTAKFGFDFEIARWGAGLRYLAEQSAKKYGGRVVAIRRR